MADDQATIEREMYTFLPKSLRDATYKGVRLNPDGTPNRADITRSARSAVLVRIRLKAQNDPLSIPIDESARSVIVVQRLLASGISAGGPVGEPIADYIFTYSERR